MGAGRLQRGRTHALVVAVVVAAVGGVAALYSVASAAIAPDTQAPTRPGTPVAVRATPTTIAVTWTPSTDNVGVVRYRVETLNLDSTRTALSTTNSATLTNVGPAPLVLAVSAFDAAGNQSPYALVRVS